MSTIKTLYCTNCQAKHAHKECPLDLLPFQESSSLYIPTREEYLKYQKVMLEKNFNGIEIVTPIAHYVTYFSKNFTSVDEVFPYAKHIMKQLGYTGKVEDGYIIWTC